jgi:hypothetical protein
VVPLFYYEGKVLASDMKNQASILLLPVLILVFSTFGQANAQTKCNGLYQCSLAAYAEAKAQRDGPGHDIIVMESSILRDIRDSEIFPSAINSSAVEYLATRTIKQRCQKTGKPVPIVDLLPMRERKGLLIVRCAEYGAYTRHGKLILGVYGGYEVYWRFDCSTNEYIKTTAQWYPGSVL